MRRMFNGDSGRKPSAEARRYIYAVMASALETDLTDRDGWVFGGMTDEFDRRRARKAALLVIEELIRKSVKP